MPKGNWEEIMCKRNARIHKRKEEMTEIKAKTKALLTDQDYAEHERSIIHTFPEIKNEPSLITHYKERFLDQFVTSQIKVKLGEEMDNQYNHLGELNTIDESRNTRSLKYHKIS